MQVSGQWTNPCTYGPSSILSVQKPLGQSHFHILFVFLGELSQGSWQWSEYNKNLSLFSLLSMKSSQNPPKKVYVDKI